MEPNRSQYDQPEVHPLVQALEEELSIESGFVDLQIDEIEVDPEPTGSLRTPIDWKS